MRVALLIAGLGAGGAERVMALLAGGLANHGHEVSLITLASAGEDFYAVDPRVRRIGIALRGDSCSRSAALRANVQRLRALRRAIADVAPDVVLSFVTRMNVLVILASLGMAARVIVSERIDPASHREQWPWAGLRRLVYGRADAVVVQTEHAADWFRQHFGSGTRVFVVPNPVTPASSVPASVRLPQPTMLAAGRLVKQKGFDILIEAFATMSQALPQLTLAIAGEGPEAPGLQALVAKLGLSGRVLFLGQVADLPALMRQAYAFILLSSRYEGFPNVLLEALANGAAVIASDCPSGPREILRGGAYGLLVPAQNPEALARAGMRLATDAGLRQRLAHGGPAAAAEYSLEPIVARWESILSGREPNIGAQHPKS